MVTHLEQRWDNDLHHRIPTIHLAIASHALEQSVALRSGERVTSSFGHPDAGITLLHGGNLQDDHLTTLGAFREHLGSNVRRCPEGDSAREISSNELPVLDEPFHEASPGK